MMKLIKKYKERRARTRAALETQEKLRQLLFNQELLLRGDASLLDWDSQALKLICSGSQDPEHWKDYYRVENCLADDLHFEGSAVLWCQHLTEEEAQMTISKVAYTLGIDNLEFKSRSYLDRNRGVISATAAAIGA